MSARNRLIAAAITTMVLWSSSHAQHIPSNIPTLGAGTSGVWFNPDQPAHALQVEILDGARAVVGWYTYDASGAPLWLLGIGSFTGLELTVELLAYRDGRPPTQWASAEPVTASWGTAILNFTGCDVGEMSWVSNNPAFGNGSMTLARYSSIQGQRCFAEESWSQQITYSFERRRQGFELVVADLPADYDSSFYEVGFERSELPAPLQGFTGLRVSGNNHSDDLALLVSNAVGGLEPGTLYRVELEADIASNVPSGCSGVGGSPGEGVYLKLGAAGLEPQAAEDTDDGWLRLNIDYGNQSTEGANARVAGTLANSYDCSNSVEAPWELRTVSTRGRPLLIETDGEGRLWVFAGSDSAFEGLSSWYLTALRVRLEPYAAEL